VAIRIVLVPAWIGGYVVLTPISLIFSAFKPQEYDFFHIQREMWYKTLINPTVMAVSALANTIISPFVALVSPRAMVEMHIDSGLTTIAKSDESETKESELPFQADDFVGMEELHEKFDNYLEVLKEPEQAKEYGVKFPAGMLLYGPPGCGKTYTVKHLCHYAKSKDVTLQYRQLKGSDVASKWRGVGVIKMRQIFDEAKKVAPTLLFIDECEGLFPSRDRFRETYGAERTQELNEMLQMLEEAKEHNIIVIAATNHLESVDSAIFRTGRFDYTFEVKPPTAETRLKMFEAKLKGKKCEEGLDLASVVEATEGFTASDIETIVNDAAAASWKKRTSISAELLMASLATIRAKKASVAQGPQDKPEDAGLMGELKTGLNALRQLVGTIDRTAPQSATAD
ncbi:MAG: ATP-binding protein, partial [Verrucomicrobia bacterium]|nr:ATP-binding protein [Verrucomicrobiota bacterium]